ncbi:hypothetical protein BJY16_008842 [Actinoplanes octamycinicus]|uniref:Uncharacterized protein n=1 Tax=Actinoplanes octamycinicus TaxID=135948 RepID=A0A7W7MCR7_9ACTN|nr:hypothetical protein [Actinoplanes octamycinicus]MBB4745383.1 hypothetical protein [Actinoplanes octamycinicus]
MLTLMDDCLSTMLRLRAELAAARRVQFGERRAVAAQAINAAETFAASAARALAAEDSPPAPAVVLDRAA